MESDNIIVRTILEDIDKEKLLLPHFQRDYDWDTDKQKDLIASFLYDVPIGSILLLKSETDMITKTIGHNKPNSQKQLTKSQDFYLMDGQQRLTTLKGVFDDFFKKDDDADLFDKLYSRLRNRWFLDLKILDENQDIEESKLKVILDLIYRGEITDDKSLSDVKELIKKQKIVTTKKQKDPFHPYSIKNNPEDFRSYLEKNQYLALFLIFSTTEKGSLLARKYKDLLVEPTQKIFQEKWFEKIKETSALKTKFNKILKDNYQVTVNWDSTAEIKQQSRQWATELYEALRYFLTEKRRLFTIIYKDSFSKSVEAFTAMNKGGLPLSTFDIIVAKYAALQKNKLLKQRIEEKFKEICQKDIKGLPQINTDRIFDHFSPDKSQDNQKFYNLYLNMLSIFSKDSENADCIKEKQKLDLTKEDIDKHTDKAVTSISLAFRFLSGYCGVSKMSDVSYQLMILPIAKNLYNIYKKNKNVNPMQIRKIFYWYWISIFGGRYREKQSPRSIEDINNLYNFLKNKNSDKINGLKDKIFEDKDYSDFESLKNRETKSLEYPVLQFVFINSILKDDLSNYDEVTAKLQSKDFEESHLISLDDYNKKKKLKENDKIKRGKKHYINSVFNLAFLSKAQNQFDRSKSWHEWNQKDLKKENILMPEKIDESTWDQFNKEIKNANADEMEQLCENFVESRFDAIKKAVLNRLQKIEKQWKN